MSHENSKKQPSLFQHISEENHISERDNRPFVSFKQTNGHIYIYMCVCKKLICHLY